MSYAQGWRPDPEAVAAAREHFRNVYGASSFSEARPELKGYARRQIERGILGVFHQESEKAVLGHYRKPEFQQRGTCTSRAFFRAIQTSLYVALAKNRVVSRAVELCYEPIYGGARVNIAGGRWARDEDGIDGGSAARWVDQCGVIERGVYGEWDLTKSREDLAVHFGAPRVGVPKVIADAGKLHQVRCHWCETTEDMADALYADYALAYACNVLWSSKRNSDGFTRPDSSGAHFEMIDAAFLCEDDKLGFGKVGSWGDNYPSGPDVLRYAGGEIKLRLGSFGTYEEDIAKWLRNGGECWALRIEPGMEFRPESVEEMT